MCEPPGWIGVVGDEFRLFVLLTGAKTRLFSYDVSSPSFSPSGKFSRGFPNPVCFATISFVSPLPSAKFCGGFFIRSSAFARSIRSKRRAHSIFSLKVKSFRIAKFLKEYWGVKRGGDRKSKDNNCTLKTIDDVAEAIGETARNAKVIMKLNDLIPELQSLVSAGKLGTTAAEQLAELKQKQKYAG